MRHIHFDRLELMSPADTGSEAAAPAAETSSPAEATPAESAEESEEGRGSRRTLRGKVVSDRMNKTITVRVERLSKHAKYEKYIRHHKKHHAHDEEGIAHMGDEVEIRECRPLSKIKRWRLIQVIRQADRIEGGDA